jgi:adenosylcobinamide hydrolase
MFDHERTDDRLTIRQPGTRWLSNGFNGGHVTADAAHNLTVPEEFTRTDLSAYVAERLGSIPKGPALLTGVQQANARGAHTGAVEVVATAGLSNPAVLPVRETPEERASDRSATHSGFDPGTVNIFVGSTEPLTDGGLAGVLATAVEAKTATLSAIAGCTGTTSDAIAVGCPDEQEAASFAGSATAIGNATRVCVREAISGALAAHYDGIDRVPEPEGAPHGIVTTGKATPFRP